MEFRTFGFIGPSGYKYQIREQNGADEDILSNLSDMKTLMNLTKFIAAIVVTTLYRIFSGPDVCNRMSVAEEIRMDSYF